MFLRSVYGDMAVLSMLRLKSTGSKRRQNAWSHDHPVSSSAVKQIHLIPKLNSLLRGPTLYFSPLILACTGNSLTFSLRIPVPLVENKHIHARGQQRHKMSSTPLLPNLILLAFSAVCVLSTVSLSSPIISCHFCRCVVCLPPAVGP